MNKLNLCKAFSHLDKLMDEWGIRGDYCVVGSLALSTLGGFDVTPHDIDIEVRYCVGADEKFRTLAAAYGSKFHEQTSDSYDSYAERRMLRPVTWFHKPYIFELDGVKVNVWMVREFSNRYVQLANGVKYALPVDVLDRKFAYRRPKDIQFGLQLISIITKWIGGSDNGTK